MFNPVLFMLKAQETAVMAWWSGAHLMTTCWMRVAENQMQLWSQMTHRRAIDLGTVGRTIPTGPDLKDHYGRRARDVDVEHI